MCETVIDVERFACRMYRVHPVSSCFAKCDRLTRPLCSSPITGLHCSYESVRPSAPPRYSGLAVLAAWASPLTSERLVPAVPCHRQHPLHALSTPVATCSVTRHPAGSSQENTRPLVLTTLDFLTNDASSKGSLSFVSRMHTCASFPRAFPPTHTTDGF